MQLKEIFKKFVHIARENPNYLVALLDTNHCVTEASDENVCGEIISQDMDPARNRQFEIKINNQLEGYLWIHIHEQDNVIGMVSKLFYDSLRTRIAHELEQENSLEKLSLEDQLVNELVIKKSADSVYVRDLMNKLKLDDTIPRTAIYVLKNDVFDRQEVTNLKYRISDQNTFYSLINEHTLKIFKPQSKSKTNIDMRRDLMIFVSELVEWGLTNCYYAIGTPQYQVRLYVNSYSSCQWVMKNVVMVKDKPYFFTDHIFGYFCSRLDAGKLDNLFDYYYQKVINMDAEEMVEIAEALFNSNFNINVAANVLYLHRNTLLYKLRGYESLFKINIRGSMQGKIMFFLFSDLLKRTL
ncbi:PucR family transcriptional regulator [Liquorilactobacillus satsumensis]|uniref:PucR family transcriptional regulator n=1 Tax=Liquorilactobacillus satsumensis TaxID=259059 RepID=UPI001E3CE1F0|nr:helix-turn-helix domain-containing protein [Liquorilactobacillus satsumensis]MCC7667793.1 hypothetical protein [Liquorilactobacillus satsumensis]MCP9356900.1 helix-turn-helix domain-containing protein [Liquorilactobacillus satsumensis]MCP9370847.1 helix-turn-helix domain-containing protein [Liquorilactobacillus satsumensis]